MWSRMIAVSFWITVYPSFRDGAIPVCRPTTDARAHSAHDTSAAGGHLSACLALARLPERSRKSVSLTASTPVEPGH